MENSLLPTSKAPSFDAIKNLLQLKFLINKIIGSFVVAVVLQLLERQIFLNEVIDRQHSVCVRACFKRKMFHGRLMKKIHNAGEKLNGYWGSGQQSKQKLGKLISRVCRVSGATGAENIPGSYRVSYLAHAVFRGCILGSARVRTRRSASGKAVMCMERKTLHPGPPGSVLSLIPFLVLSEQNRQSASTRWTGLKADYAWMITVTLNLGFATSWNTFNYANNETKYAKLNHSDIKVILFEIS